jgi:hypothetical protein
MGNVGLPVTYKGRILGVVILVAVQTLIGITHGFFGVFLLVTGFSEAYSVYTFSYGLLTVISAYGLWMTSRWGWIGTLVISGFVIIIDSMTLLNTPILSEIPIFAAVTETLYSLAVLLYLIQPKIQHTFLKT